MILEIPSRLVKSPGEVNPTELKPEARMYAIPVVIVVIAVMTGVLAGMVSGKGAFTRVLLAVAVASSPWTATNVAGIAPADTLVFLACCSALPWLFRDIGIVLRTGPLVLVLFLMTVVNLGFYSELDSAGTYLMHVSEATYVPIGVTATVQGPWTLMLKLIIAWIVAPVVASVVVKRSGQRYALVLVNLFIAGAALSAVVAVYAYVSGVQLANTLLGIPVWGDRQVGLASHPNDLGGVSLLALATIVLSGPVSGGLRGVRVIEGGALGMAICLSGSRGAVLAACLIPAVWLYVKRGNGRKRAWIPPSAVLVASLLVYLNSRGLFDALLRALRFTSETGSQSNRQRVGRMSAAFDAWMSRPFSGQGLRFIETAHNLELQVLSAGGIVLAVAMVGTALALWKHCSSYGEISRSCTHKLRVSIQGAVLVFLSFLQIENQLTQRYFFLMLGVLVGLHWIEAREVVSSTGMDPGQVSETDSNLNKQSAVSTRTSRRVGEGSLGNTISGGNPAIG